MAEDVKSTYNLKRFLDAQEYDYARALAEIRAGRKTSHWIWYIFPQLKGLGHSSMCDRYGIQGAGEAAAYLAHPILRARLVEISSALLALESRDAKKIMGAMGHIDAKKLRSSMTLFASVEGTDPVFAQVIDEFFGSRPDPRTLEMLASEAES